MKVVRKVLFSLVIIILLIITLFLMFIVPWKIKEIPEKEDRRIISYNVKYAEDWLDSFTDRKEIIYNQLLSYDADFIALQEANYGWMNEENGLPVLLNDYDYVGVGREDGNTQGEYASIFYLKEKYELLESNTIWLSETKEEVSVGWMHQLIE